MKSLILSSSIPSINRQLPKVFIAKKSMDLNREIREVQQCSFKSRVSKQACRSVVEESLTSVPLESWSEFSAQASGEWDGYGADFDVEGKPIGLPESVIPSAFKEWGIDVYDWQTQAPTIANVDGFPKFYTRTVKLLPTVGCEADAATLYSVEEKYGEATIQDLERAAIDLTTVSTSSSFVAYSTGSYGAVWPGKVVPTGRSGFGNATAFARKLLPIESPQIWEIEQTLQNPVTVDGIRSDRRVRVIVKFEQEKSISQPKIKGLSVFKEKWEGEFRNGTSLGGCGQAISAFAEAKKLKFEQLLGKWKFNSSDSSVVLKSLLKGDSGGQLIELPQDLWVEYFFSNSNPLEYSIIVGWYVSKDKVLVSSFDNREGGIVSFYFDLLCPCFPTNIFSSFSGVFNP